MKKLTRSLPVQPHRDAWVEVNLNALEANVAALRQFVPAQQRLMAIVKADAYGHGAVMTLPTLIASGVEMVGVASIDEGVQIREAGFDIPVLVVGPSPSWAYAEALEHHIQLTVFKPEHILQLNALAEQRGVKAQLQLKVDTGMHRIGAKPNELPEIYDALASAGHVELVGIFSHLACSDDEAYTRGQHDGFQAVLKGMPESLRSQCEWVHLSNSTGLMYPFIRGEGDEVGKAEISYTAVRLGIALWGYWDTPNVSKGDSDVVEDIRKDVSGKYLNLPKVHPVMSLRGRIVHLHEISQNEGVSYTHSDRRYRTNRQVSPPVLEGDGLVSQVNQCVDGDVVLNSVLSSQNQSNVQDLDVLSSQSSLSRVSSSSSSQNQLSGDVLSSQINPCSINQKNNINTIKRMIATCPIGYADGIPRLLSNQLMATLKTPDGQWYDVPQVGNITMDQLMFDVTQCPNVAVGDTLTFFGYTVEHAASVLETHHSELSVNHAKAVESTAKVATLTDWARQVQSIEYELMCSLRVRLPRTYTRHTAFKV